MALGEGQRLVGPHCRPRRRRRRRRGPGGLLRTAARARGRGAARLGRGAWDPYQGWLAAWGMMGI